VTYQTFVDGYALLIGVGADLPVTVQDASALRDVLVDPSRAAYPPAQVMIEVAASEVGASGAIQIIACAAR
jgi:hypothetical protein